MTSFPIQPSFARGELSPRLHARVDIDHYKTALAYCSNFYVLRQGGIRRRPGTKYIQTAKTGGVRVTVRPFTFLVTGIAQDYVLEFGDYYLRFHTAAGTVFNGGVPYEIATPWPWAAGYELQFQQVGDVIRIAHGSYETKTLRRYGETDWRILPIIFEDGPYQDIIADGTVLTPSSNGGIIQGVTGYTTAGLGVVSSTSELDPAWAAWQAFDSNGNTEWMAGSPNEGEAIRFRFYTPTIVTGYVVGSSPREESYVEDSVIYKIPGSLRAPRSWVFEASNNTADDATGPWITLDSQAAITGWGEGERRYFTFNNLTPYAKYQFRVQNINESTSIARPCSIGTLKFATGGADIGLLTLTVSSADPINGGLGFQPDDAGRHIRFLSEDAYWHWFKILGVVNDVEVDVEMYSPPLPSTNGTTNFQLGAFGNIPGWPARVGIYQDRIVYARTNAQPETVWESRTDDFDSFATTIPAHADDGISFTIAQAGEIQWLLEGADLLLGTEAATRNLGPANPNEGFSATNFKQGKPVRTGAAPVSPATTGIASLFVGRLRTTLHELTYDFSVDGYVAPDIAVLSDHLLRAGVIDLAYAFQPNAVLWLVLNDGTLVAMTYEREQKMVALTRQSLGGNAAVESVCVVPGTDRDQVWFTVNRYGVRTIEVLQPDFEGGNQPDAFYVDCGVTYTGAPATIITGLPPIMNNQMVSILADGAVEAPALVTAVRADLTGQVTLPSGIPASTIQIGFGYQSKMTTLRLAQGSSDGSGLGRKKILKKILVDVLETGDLKAAAVKSDASPQQMILRSSDVGMGDPVPLVTGSLAVRCDDRWDNAGVITLTVDDPLPCTILAITPGYESEP